MFDGNTIPWLQGLMLFLIVISLIVYAYQQKVDRETQLKLWRFLNGLLLILTLGLAICIHFVLVQLHTQS